MTARANDPRPADATTQTRIEAHLAEYGEHTIDYDEAFDLAIPAVVSSEEDIETPRSIVRADAEERADGPVSDEELDRLMRALVGAGTFELLGVGETSSGRRYTATQAKSKCRASTDTQLSSSSDGKVNSATL